MKQLNPPNCINVMTEQHPLTDQIIQEELITRDECDHREGEGRGMYYEEDFRTGADWQLEQCLEFLRTHPFEERDDYEDLGTIDYAYLLEEAMRPPVVVTLKGQILDVLNEDTMAMGSQLHRIRKLVDQMENNS